MRKRRRYGKKKNGFKFVIIGCIIITVFLSVGYGAFQTNVSINTKGNIKRITVTLDPNGGYVDYNTKEVSFGAKYGLLPTPSRDGYTFLGWNGKNMFNPQEFYKIGSNYNVQIDNNDIILNTYPYQENYTKLSLDFKENTQYTLSYDWYVEKINGTDSDYHISSGLAFWYYNYPFDTSSNERFSSGKLYESGHKIMISDITKNVQYISSSGWQFIGTMRLYNILLEEGDKPTEYEPYYITSETEVVQKKDHTLTAIWEKNN